MLADLRFPIYITTNYDDFTYEALADRGRAPQRAICPWYTTNRKEVRQANALFSEKKSFDPDSTRPIVCHLHGHRGVPESLVLTKDDYIDFLVRISGDSALLPPVIQSSLTNKMLLFVGISDVQVQPSPAADSMAQASSGWTISPCAPEGGFPRQIREDCRFSSTKLSPASIDPASSHFSCWRRTPDERR